MTSAVAGQEHRQLGPHQHGVGRLNIAIEGDKVEMELDAPGADIVGFESEAKTDAQKATLQASLQKLKDVATLYKLPAAAGCTVTEAEAKVEKDEHEHEQAAGKKDEDAHEHEHSDVNAGYKLQCRAPQAIKTIEFGYFAAFPKAQKLQVTIVSGKGQQQFDVTREKPTLSLEGVI
jgi:hypothetical protein